MASNDTLAKIEKRQAANLALVHMLLALVQAHPELRLGQIFKNYDFVKRRDEDGNWLDEFYVEPVDLLARVKKAVVKGV